MLFNKILRQNQSFNPFSPESKDMIHEVGNIELCELLEDGTQSTVQGMLIILGRRHRLLHVRALLANRNRGEQEICPIHHGSPLDSQLLHKERATPLAPLREEARGSRVLHRQPTEEEVQEEVLPGIHDRFIRDEKFRNRLIENGRDEDVCRLMDALADEDHTHHLTPQEYYFYKSNWWLRSKKTGSDTVPVQRRPDFKQALSTLQ